MTPFQQFEAASGIPNLADGVAVVAWGMMPVGLLLSGVIVRAADGAPVRETALSLPFWVAARGAGVLTIAAWWALALGFADDPDKKI